jgi:phosphoribosylformylglycinamidine (FGAM) synthase-like amidotransferase family enzyme
MMSNLRELIPGSDLWPRFVRNQSDRFEARFSLVEVTQSPSLLLQGMAGSMMPIAVSHGEGQVEVRDSAHLAQLESKGLVALRFVDNFGKVTESYPANPNGSPNGITAVTSESGRATIMMPHPNAYSARWLTPGTRKTGARIARGCVSSATRVNSWANIRRVVQDPPFRKAFPAEA